MGKISGSKWPTNESKQNKREKASEPETQVRWSRLGRYGRKDYEWAIAWGIIKAFFLLAPLIAVAVTLVLLFLAGSVG